MNTPSNVLENSPMLELEGQLNSLPTPEEKIALGLSFLRSSISSEGAPRFREFWGARQLILPLFRENIHPSVRSKLWGEYVELTTETRKLKEILDEQSAFAIEQIDLAIGALEGDMVNFETLLKQMEAPQFVRQSPTLREKEGAYQSIQRELNLLNALSSRLQGLRKEVVKTDMRMRFRTKFFKSLSELGNTIFPRRKQLIEQVSEEFQGDVEQFVVRHFCDGNAVGAPYFVLREEIKVLQGMAKSLTLSSSAFNQTRLKLSECWDVIRSLEQEHKKEIVLKKQAEHESRREIESQMAEQEAQAKAREAVEAEKLRLKRERIADLKGAIGKLLEEGAPEDGTDLEEAFLRVQGEVLELGLAKVERQSFDRLLRQLKNFVAESKESALLNLSDDHRQALQNLRIVLEQKKGRRQEIKEQIETHRRALGSSNLDIEKGMQIRELMEQEKELLATANAAIVEIEEKMIALSQSI